jgi:hypothetical protein
MLIPKRLLNRSKIPMRDKGTCYGYNSWTKSEKYSDRQRIQSEKNTSG